MELIQVEVMVSPILLGNFSSSHHRLLDAGEQQTSQQCRIVLTKTPTRQVDDENASLVHSLADASDRNGSFGLLGQVQSTELRCYFEMN